MFLVVMPGIHGIHLPQLNPLLMMVPDIFQVQSLQQAQPQFVVL
ncbi:hypothetical protein SEEGA711_24705 [Salmonella enterica subsp. enterica serovar Gaminara str. ATCC BAA-711]|uniref:Uncharacterized protein n=1 Tax=Salmonella enterica subsp. enterica serovar Rubislaw str. A4-653 TaxID=913081 RepID=G5QKI7_SALRU|nr:hypothetical protein LTSERUB_3198 [Salmonella enterica subsp. enterica serovar Rubislaw str. A4-653]ESH15190.1 hypothetical protein SEEGA711_24705 [Salmonella enterica subsp. enterica serovar Gaminara str. ATCC BAA-711]